MELTHCLQEWWHVLKSGGVIALGRLGGQALQPYLAQLTAALTPYGVLLPTELRRFHQTA